ncbi:snaclec coagulation factor IX/factor X-binding protein subunit B [Aphis craccivora]|uniref:Snaclec coagulation factor IX/factor X-binding protein subunit B n=1 Tax=Aphis craccivora TaxID=307492 RepID=A0A6G0YYB1_APHCR|nr:snaclec coagulation factor IX/factor X-binding protein subunit B [Aphis craccivora]
MFFSCYICESKLMYNCQNKFSKFGSNCYYLSKETATWQEAFYECNNLAKGSKLVVLAKEVEDHNIRKFLKYRKNETKERWIGGIYDWSQDQWKWAASGRKIRYNRFETIQNFNNNRNDQWQCLSLDPSIDYKWNAQSCLQKKNFICETKPQPECVNITV